MSLETVIAAGFLPQSLHNFLNCEKIKEMLKEGTVAIMKIPKDTYFYIPYGFTFIPLSLAAWEKYVDKKLSKGKRVETDFISAYVSIPVWCPSCAKKVPKKIWDEIGKYNMEFLNKEKQSGKYDDAIAFWPQFIASVEACS